jgi:hypothetical protein
LLQRHLHFGDTTDLANIRERDWPACKAALAELVYEGTEALPVPMTDLAAVVAARPSGQVSSGLNWNVLTDESFERLVFNLICDSPGYVNAAWLTKTTAADHGRDLSAIRIRTDALCGERRDRVIIQCKRWERSITDTDVADTLVRLKHWEPPRIDVVVFATSGRFTENGVRYIERHNEDIKVPDIQMWPESHLERLLAARPDLVATFVLR